MTETLPQIRSVADLAAIERIPLEQRLPARSMYGLLERANTQFGSRAAFQYLADADLATPAEITTYAQLFAEVTRAANLFHELGVAEQHSVAILAPNIPVAHFALWGAETVARACPINVLLDPHHVAGLIRAADAHVLVALGPDDNFPIWSHVQEVCKLVELDAVLVLGDVMPDDESVRSFEHALARQPSDKLTFQRELDWDTPAALFHTGGTTGLPKLAQHHHGHQLHTSWSGAAYYALTSDDVMLNGFPLFHVAGSLVYGASCFVAGAAQLLPTRTGMRNNGFVEQLWSFIEREKVSVLSGVPTTLARMLQIPLSPGCLDGVRLFLSGGSPLPIELANAAEAHFDRPVRNIFGMTESAGLVSVEPCQLPRAPGSVGFALPYSEVRAVKWNDGEATLDDVCAPGETGVLALRGANVVAGYTDVSRNPGTFEREWLISGDMGHVDAFGRVYVTGRSKDVIIRGAHNIDPAVIEEVVAGHPAVAVCAAVGQPDAYAGELPVCYVTLKPNADTSAEAIRDFALPLIPEPPARPRWIGILDEMPVTAVGKIYKPELRRRASLVVFAQVLDDLINGHGLRLSASEANGQVSMTIAVAQLSPVLEAELNDRLRDFSLPWAVLTDGC
jgi:fatty-acyl-CoA synthase